MDARHQEGCDEKTNLHVFSFFAKGYRTMTSGWARGPVFSGDTTGVWFQNRRFRSRKVGGATVERLGGVTIIGATLP